MLDKILSNYIELSVALLFGVIFFIMATSRWYKNIFFFLVAIIPFQLISSVYGTLNVVLTYLFGFGASGALKKNISQKKPIMLFSFILLFLYSCISVVLAPRMFLQYNLVYLVTMLANVMLFYLSYYFINSEQDVERFFKTLFICNLMVVFYCVLQMMIGFGKFNFLGLGDLAINQNRSSIGMGGMQQRRLTGPFSGPGITAEFLVLMSIIWFYCMFFLKTYKKHLSLMLLANFSCLVATANRGGFIALFLGVLGFLLLFRKKMGVASSFKVLAVFVISIVLASVFVIRFTQFNILYDRLAMTEVHGLTPDTRGGWAEVVERIKDKPLLGHGPRIVTEADLVGGDGDLSKTAKERLRGKTVKLPAGEIGYQPHSLYLSTLYTLGVVGSLFCVLLLFNLWRHISARPQNRGQSPFIANINRLAVLVLAIMLIDQFKIEFTRFVYSDYQQFLAALFGMFCAANQPLQLAPPVPTK